MPQITKIVITGGPCGGKSSALEIIRPYFEEKGYKVLIMAETATELINSGIAPKTFITITDYQKCQIKLQLEKENVFMQAAEKIPADKILIVCDRGLVDCKAYMGENAYLERLKSLGLSEQQVNDGYDAVFHLVTTAKGAVKYYTTANNSARTESPEESSELDDKVIWAWQKHKYVKIIDNSTDFNGKMERLLEEISIFLEKIN